MDTVTDLFFATPLWLLALAAFLDMRLRYPPALPHPVQGLGRWLNLLEPFLRTRASCLARFAPSPPGFPRNGEILAGAAGLLATLLLTGIMVRGLIRLPLLGSVCAVFFCASGLALGQLLRDGRDALTSLERNDLPEARRRVGWLVSRDVSRAEPAELYRALAESLSENFNDAFAAPLFWLTLGGPVALWLYKAVSTMDSMWGYRTPRWEYLGKAAARLDDVLAFLPARLSALLLWFTAECMPFSQKFRGGWPGLNAVRGQAAAMSSPNAGWPMACAAWLHRAGMGGPTVYHGAVTDKPRLGPPEAESWDSPRIHDLLRHLRRSGLAGVGLALLVLWAASTL
jgi:adenosylcobinamide-phosphate synthase